MDARLLEILVCPLCKGPLQYERTAQELICSADKLAYPIQDGIPVMLAEEARTTVEGRRVDPAGGAAPAGTTPGSTTSPDISAVVVAPAPAPPTKSEPLV